MHLDFHVENQGRTRQALQFGYRGQLLSPGVEDAGRTVIHCLHTP